VCLCVFVHVCVLCVPVSLCVTVGACVCMWWGSEVMWQLELSLSKPLEPLGKRDGLGRGAGGERGEQAWG
jgi:hypothetical protein